MIAGCLCLPAEVLDRVLLIVNNSPILLSDWDAALRCEAFLAGRTPASYTPAEQQAAFKRLVDQELLVQQIRGYLLPAVPMAEVTSRVQELRKQVAEADDDQAWRDALNRAGITEDELRQRLQTEIEIERFIDVRFRSGIRIDDISVNNYYRDQFLPKLRLAGGKDVPLNSVSGKIREILLQQRMAEQQAAWLQTLREQAEIRTPGPGFSGADSVEVTPSK